MKSNEVEASVRKIVAEVARREVAALGDDDDLVEKLGLDSLQGLQMLAAVEKRFDVRFPDERLVDLRTIRRLTDAIHAAKKETRP